MHAHAWLTLKNEIIITGFPKPLIFWSSLSKNVWVQIPGNRSLARKCILNVNSRCSTNLVWQYYNNFWWINMVGHRAVKNLDLRGRNNMPGPTNFSNFNEITTTMKHQNKFFQNLALPFKTVEIFPHHVLNGWIDFKFLPCNPAIAWLLYDHRCKIHVAPDLISKSWYHSIHSTTSFSIEALYFGALYFGVRQKSENAWRGASQY